MTQWNLNTEERAVFALRSLYRRYGYTPYKMSRFEEYDLYVRNKDFLVSDKIITFSGDGGRLLALKPDVTLSIVKNAPDEAGAVQKVYYNENVYRDYREILQAGLECVGDLGDYEIAEVVLLAAKSLEALDSPFVLDISHMGLIDAMLDSCGFGNGQKRQAMEYVRRKNRHGLKAMCSQEAWEKLGILVDCHGGLEELSRVEQVLTTQGEKKAIAELRQLMALLEASGFGKKVRLDFSVGSDLRYYSGVVFRGYLEGIPSSVLSGGQYDKLPQRMGRKARAIGFAIYADLLARYKREEESYDVDTLILHDGTVDPAVLTAKAGEAAKTGTVLVARQAPKGRSWKRLWKFENGEEIK